MIVETKSSPLPADILEYLMNPVEKGNDVAYARRFLVKQREEYVSVLVQDIACFYSEGRMIVLRTVDNKKYLISLSIEKLSKDLLDPFHFFRVNRSMIIAYKSIKDVWILSNHRLRVVLRTPFERNIYVSRYTIQGFKKWLGE